MATFPLNYATREVNAGPDFHFRGIVARQTHACAAQVREQIDAVAFALANPNASNTPLENYITGDASIKAPLPA